MTTPCRPHHVAPALDPNRLVPTPDDAAALGVTLTDDDWRHVWDLWRTGASAGGLHRLLRLRARYRQQASETDGLDADPRARFARWLVATGRLHEGA